MPQGNPIAQGHSLLLRQPKRREAVLYVARLYQKQTTALTEEQRVKRDSKMGEPITSEMFTRSLGSRH
jgi:hypothetical protein